MYNFNDLRVCFAPYRCNNRNGIIIGIIPMDITSNTELLRAIEKCMYSDEVYEFINNSMIAKEWFYKIREYTNTFEMDFRRFHLKGYTLVSIESPGTEEDSKIVKTTWQKAAEDMIQLVEFKHQQLRDYDLEDFSDSTEEYEFYIKAMKLGTINTIHMMAENSTSLLLHAFLKTSIYRKHYLNAQYANPSFSDVIETRKKLKKRWKLPVNSYAVIDGFSYKLPALNFSVA